MSGGILDPQQEQGEHQVVMFTFAGPLKREDCEEWNRQIVALKARFGNQVMGVTIRGQKTAARWRSPRAAPRTKRR